MNKSKLDKFEREVLAAFERGELKSGLTATRKKLIRSAVEQTVKNLFQGFFALYKSEV